MSKYIEIVEGPPNPRTRTWRVVNVRTDQVCGEIRWWGGFRKYVFYPSDGFRFDAECLAMVAFKLNEVNAKKKA